MATPRLRAVAPGSTPTAAEEPVVVSRGGSCPVSSTPKGQLRVDRERSSPCVEDRSVHRLGRVLAPLCADHAGTP
jgi:hypothetical protein